jgi:flagellar motor switch protein FliM
MSPTEEGKLSKSEMEALLQATREEEPAPERPEAGRRVQKYDFRQPSRFNRSQLEKLKNLNEPLVQNASTHASRMLRSSVKTQLVSIDQMKWENLLDELGDAAAGFVFTLAPLGRHGVAALDKQFASACLERMMGGQGAGADAALIEFTDVDVHVLAHMVTHMLSPLPELWARLGSFQVEVGSFMQDLQGLDVFTPDEDFLQVCLLMQSSVGSGRISLCVPFDAVRSLPPESDEAEMVVAATEEETAAGLRESLSRTRMELTALLGTADIKVESLLRAEPGDVIILDKRVGNGLEVRVNGLVKFRGLPGVRNGKVAIKLILEE